MIGIKVGTVPRGDRVTARNETGTGGGAAAGIEIRTRGGVTAGSEAGTGGGVVAGTGTGGVTVTIGMRGGGDLVLIRVIGVEIETTAG